MLARERLALFDNVIIQVMRDPKSAGLRAPLFEAFYEWARRELERGELPEALAVRLRDAMLVAKYCRPGGALHAAAEALEGAPLPPGDPCLHAIKRYFSAYLSPRPVRQAGAARRIREAPLGAAAGGAEEAGPAGQGGRGKAGGSEAPGRAGTLR